MFLALRELKFARGRFALMGSVIALIAILTVLLSGLSNGLVNDGISGLRALPVTHLGFQEGADSTFSRSTVTTSDIDKIAAVADTTAEPFGLTLVNATDDAEENFDLALMGLADGGFVSTDIVGDTPIKPGTVVVTQGLIDAGLSVGDTLHIDRSPVSLTVAAAVDHATYGHVDVAYLSLADWQAVSNRDAESDPNTASAVAIKHDGDDAALVKAGLDARLDVVTRTAAYAGSPGYSAETSTMSLIQSFLYLISAMILGSFFTVWTIQRRAEIGLQKALGASGVNVLTEALGQVLIVLTAATALGSLVGFLLGKLIEGGEVPFSLGLGTAASAAIILIIAGAIGMLVGIRRVTSVDPIIALGAAS